MHSDQLDRREFILIGRRDRMHHSINKLPAKDAVVPGIDHKLGAGPRPWGVVFQFSQVVPERTPRLLKSLLEAFAPHFASG
jgi:hypothetical protein